MRVARAFFPWEGAEPRIPRDRLFLLLARRLVRGKCCGNRLQIVSGGLEPRRAVEDGIHEAALEEVKAFAEVIGGAASFVKNELAVMEQPKAAGGAAGHAAVVDREAAVADDGGTAELGTRGFPRNIDQGRGVIEGVERSGQALAANTRINALKGGEHSLRLAQQRADHVDEVYTVLEHHATLGFGFEALGRLAGIVLN